MMREFSIPALFHRQIMWAFMILALFECEIGRESYLPSILFFSSELRTRTHLRIVRLCCRLNQRHLFLTLFGFFSGFFK